MTLRNLVKLYIKRFLLSIMRGEGVVNKQHDKKVFRHEPTMNDCD